MAFTGKSYAQYAVVDAFGLGPFILPSNTAVEAGFRAAQGGVSGELERAWTLELFISERSCIWSQYARMSRKLPLGE